MPICPKCGDLNTPGHSCFRSKVCGRCGATYYGNESTHHVCATPPSSGIAWAGDWTLSSITIKPAPIQEEGTMNVYLVAVFDESDETKPAFFVVEPQWVLATDEDRAKMQLARMLDDTDAARLDDLTFLVHSF